LANSPYYFEKGVRVFENFILAFVTLRRTSGGTTVDSFAPVRVSTLLGDNDLDKPSKHWILSSSVWFCRQYAKTAEMNIPAEYMRYYTRVGADNQSKTREQIEELKSDKAIVKATTGHYYNKAYRNYVGKGEDVKKCKAYLSTKHEFPWIGCS
jgi:hypothetical protein